MPDQEPQWLEAKRLADEVRKAHSHTKKHVASLDRKTAIEHVARILLNPNTVPHGNRMKIGDLIRSIPMWGAAHVRRLLQRANVSDERRQLERLTRRQRVLICNELRASVNLPGFGEDQAA